MSDVTVSDDENDDFIQPVPSNPISSDTDYVDNVDEAFSRLQTHELHNKVQYSIYVGNRNTFGKTDWTKAHKKIIWSQLQGTCAIPFDGVPYMSYGKLLLDCRHGPDRNIALKTRIVDQKYVQKCQSKADYTIKRRKNYNVSTKFGCKAQVKFVEVVKFPDYKIDVSTKKKREKASKALRLDLENGKDVRTERRIYYQFPTEHSNHPYGENSPGLHQQIDSRIIKQIHVLVADGVYDAEEMKRHLKIFVKNYPFELEQCQRPTNLDRRFFPSMKDIGNAMYRAKVKLRFSKIDQENLQHMVEGWVESSPHDSFFFRPFQKSPEKRTSDEEEEEEEGKKLEGDSEGDSDTRVKLLFIHQTKEQKRLLNLYGNDLFLLDATYRITRYALPLFFVVVRTNVDYQVVGSFIVQDETTECITEALAMLKSWNPRWSPDFAMTDKCDEEITAIESVFQDCKVLLCDFHREQAWSRWLRKGTNNMSQHKAELQARMRKIARSATEDDFKKAVNDLKNCPTWKRDGSERLRQWFEGTWLKDSKRWVNAYRNNRLLAFVNTNNGVERQNRTFKQGYLRNRRTYSLSMMAKSLVEEYIPTRMNESYVKKNNAQANYYRDYLEDENIPPYLFNRPQHFVKHCSQRKANSTYLHRKDILEDDSFKGRFQVCQHPHMSMRSWGAEATTSLVRAALGHKYTPPLHKNVRVQSMLLAPLQELSSVMHPDIRQKQLECVLQILHGNGDNLGQGWPLILGVIGAVTNDQGESLIRIAFQSLQLVVTDFLPLMPPTCLQVVVEVASKFGKQSQELNISLTAIGLLWNISDYFYQNQDKIKANLESEAGKENKDMPPFDNLWMCLYAKLGDLCVDPRPAVRKSAGQTLFSTIGAHGSLLQQKTWQTVLWQVLFPLLEKVKKHSSSAPNVKTQDPQQMNILIHHSRDTAEKQWAETQVLTLAGVARVFNAKRSILQLLGDFPRAWALLLEFIEAAALCRNAEVSLAALKSFQEILQINREKSAEEWKLLMRQGSKDDILPPMSETMNRSGDITKAAEADIPKGSGKIDDVMLWSNAWRVWLAIGSKVTVPPENKTTDMYVPSQPFLTALIQIFPALFEHIKQRFVASDLQKLSSVLQGALAVPVQGDASPFIVPTSPDSTLTGLQEAVLNAVDVLQKEVYSGSESMQSMYPDLFDQLLTFIEYAVRQPRYGKIDSKSISTVRGPTVDYVTMNFVPFAEKSLMLVVEMYKTTAKHPAVIHEHVMQNILKALKIPLGLKYGCPSQTTWTLAINSMFTVLSIGLPVARKHEAAFHGMWIELATTFEEFLFSKNPPPPTLSVEDYQRDEAIDCKVVHVIRDDILPYALNIPQEFVMQIMNILNRGSIHSATSESFVETDSSRKLREEFAKACFETLLQFSFISNVASSGPEGSITKLAVASLLKRCQEVLKKYVEDEKLSGKCPLPRPRMSEMTSVLKAITTLLQSLKRAPPANKKIKWPFMKVDDEVEKNIWGQVIDLYPCLVECVTSTSTQVCKALREALHEYKDMLTPKADFQNGV